MYVPVASIGHEAFSGWFVGRDFRRLASLVSSQVFGMFYSNVGDGGAAKTQLALPDTCKYPYGPAHS